MFVNIFYKDLYFAFSITFENFINTFGPRLILIYSYERKIVMKPKEYSYKIK